MKSFPRWLIVASGLAMLALIGGGYWFYLYQEQHLRENSEANLHAIAQLKVNLITAWRAERLGDAAVLMESPPLTETLAQWMADPEPKTAEQILTQLRAIQEHYHYGDALLVDVTGRIRLSLSGQTGALSEDLEHGLTTAFRERRPVFTDLEVDRSDLTPSLGLVAPSFTMTGKTQEPIGAIILKIDARQFLYPLIQFWPTPSRSAETLLVRRDGDAVLFLNDLRHQPDTALKLRIPLSRKDVPSVMAVLGKEGIVQGKDYRGVDVLCVLKSVPNSSWFMIAKMDEAEVLSEWRFRSILILALLIGLLAFLVTAVGMAWQKNGKAHYKDLFLAEAALRRAEEGHRITLMSVGDGIISTDTDGRLELLNPVAESLTGWRQEEARGKSLEEVFRIFNEETRRSVENPVSKVLREGLVVGLANHTVLVAKDGTERPIADSGAPIRDENGEITGVVLVFRDQSKERAAQKALTKQYEELEETHRQATFLADLVEKSSQPLAVGYPDGRIGIANEAFSRLVGYTKDEFATLDWATVLTPPEWQEKEGNKLEELRRTGQPVRYEKEYICKDGTRVPIELLVHLVKDQSGEPEYYYAFLNDVTERKKMEEALQEGRERLQTIFETSPAGIILVNPEGRITFANRKTGDLFSRRCEELLGTPYVDLVHPEQRSVGYEKMKALMAGEIDHVSLERAYQTADGRKFLGHISGRRMLRPDGSFEGLVGIITDITDLKLAEEALRESEERYRVLVEQSLDGMFIQQGPKILFANSRFQMMLGYSARELESLDHWSIYHPDYQELSRERAIARMRGEDVLSQYEVKLQRKDGSCFDGEISAKGVTVKGEPGVLVWVRDVSNRKRSEEVQRRLATAIEQAVEAVVITDVDGSIQYVNPAFERITGYVQEDVVGQNPRLLKSGEHDAIFYKNLWETIKEGQVWTGRFVNKRKDGSLYHADATISPVRDASGKIVNFVAVKRDITEHLELSMQLQQAQKMEAVGTLAGGIAHDFNNLLQAVLGYSELVLADEDLPRQLTGDLKKILAAGRSGADLVQRLLTFSRKTETKPLDLDLNKRIRQTQKFLQRTIPKMIDIELILAEDLVSVHADPTQVDQVIMNLAVNARDAMPEGGKLLIETANVVLDDDYARSHLEAKPGRYVLLRVSDTGSGMDKETLEHIFEPFYTTKAPGEGTGLGLAMVFGIVKQHQGFINCYSEVSHGTTFKIYLPAIISETQSEQPVVTAMPQGGTETILLVDDEELIRDLGKRILRKAGYTVLTASNGKEALEIYRKEQSGIALVILDLIMPEMGGKQCLEGLQRLNPAVKVVIASGYSGDGPTKGISASGSKAFIAKPFDMRQVLEMVRKTIDEE